MKRVLGVVSIIFIIILCVVLIENYGLTHIDTKVILVDTCGSDTVRIPIDTLSFDSIVD